MNLAGNFLKDITGNSSITNTLGSKIKNISQSNWLPETKDILANAASSLAGATNLASDNSNQNTNTQKANQAPPNQNPAQTQAGFKSELKQNDIQQKNPSNMFSSSNVSSPSKGYHQKPSNQYQQPGAESDYIKHSKYQDDEPIYEKKLPQSSQTNTQSHPQQQQQQQHPQKPLNQSRFQPEQQQQQKPSQLSRNSSYRSRSPESPPEEAVNTSSQNQIDPLQYNALFETNQALKSELQRLSVFELKCKTLEKEVKNSKSYKETNEKLENQLKDLLIYKEKYEKLELELNHIKTSKSGDDEKFKLYQNKTNSTLERIESENANLKNKIKDLDKLVEEYERNYNSLKVKEQSLEKQNKNLENELDRLSEKSSSNEMHGQKLEAIEQANRILEQELENLKEQQKTERAKVKEKMDLLNSKQNERIKKLEEEKKLMEEEFERIKNEDNVNLTMLKKQCDSMRKRIDELENYEKKNAYLEKELNELKNEMKNQKSNFLEEKKKLETESRNSSEINQNYNQLKESMANLSRKCEQDINDLQVKLKQLQVDYDKKATELNEMNKTRELETNNYLSKLTMLNDENLNLASQLKNVTNSSSIKDEELSKLRKKFNDLLSDNEKMHSQLKSYQNLENEIVDIHLKKTNAEEKIQELSAKLEEKEKAYLRDMNENKNSNQQLQQQIKQLKQEITAETLKNENLSTDYALLKLELNKLDSYKMKCESLEKELAEFKSAKNQKLNEYELTNRKYSESSDKYEYELKLLNTQVISLQNDVKIKDQECKQLEKLLEAERNKTSSLLRQMDELNSLNTQLTMQNSDAKRRLVSLDLLTEECNQLRKNLTLMTIETESRKAEVTTLNSQINIMENTIKSLRESSEKHSHLESNYENAVFELKKKQEEYKKLQHVHDTVKKEQLDTIELLEEKLRDVEKKTELQALKHEEILLELESIRARRERLLPLCPNCSTQTLAMYQPIQQYNQTHQHSQAQAQSQSQSQMHSPQYNCMTSNNSPNPVIQTQQYPLNSSITASSQQTQQHQQQQYTQQTQQMNQLLPSQQLLSIAIPQQSLGSSVISPIISPLHLQQLQGHLQVIALPGKQSVTVECQTSPIANTENLKFDFAIKKQQIEQQAIEEYKKSIYVPKVNAYCQTILSELQKKSENKEINTDPIDLSFNQTTTIINQPIAPKPTRNQAVNVNLFAEYRVSSTTQTAPVPQKVFEEKGIQSVLDKINNKPKYILYTCKYNYDPFKNSPNDNPEAELPLTAGDYLFVLSEEDDDGFYSGELLSGKRGLIPSNFVEKVNLDQSNINKHLETLPKNVIFNVKFGECLSFYNLNVGQLLIDAQEQIQKLQTTSKNESLINSLTAPQSVIAPKQTVVAKSTNHEKLILPNPTSDIDELNSSSVKIGLPYPNNLKVEKRSETSLLVIWDPPTAPLPLNQSIESDNLCASYDLNEQSVNVQSYNLYLNHELHSVINGNDDRIAVLEDIDLTVPNRISIQAVTSKGGLSKPQECTLLFGSNRSFAPSGLTIHNLTQTSAIVSWWPSSSLFSHIISIDSIEHRTLKPGIYRFKLSGLLPDTSHLVTITAQIPNHTNESSSNYAASVEFRTLPSRTLREPQDLSIEKDPNEVDTYILSWQPVVNMPNTVSNGIPVGGYSIYLDGIRVHQILNPIASSVSLSSKLLFNGAKLLTVRTLSLDGNAESKDSEPIKLTKNLMTPQVNNNAVDEIRKKQQQIPVPVPAPKVVKPQVDSLHSNIPNPPQPSMPAVQPPQNQINEPSLYSSPKKQIIDQKPPVAQTTTLVNSNLAANPIYEEKKPIPVKPQPPQNPLINQNDSTPPSNNQPLASQTKRVSTNIPINQIPRVSDANRKKLENKISVDNESDLYENNRTTTINNPVNTNAKKKTSRQSSPNSNMTQSKQNLSQTKTKDIDSTNTKLQPASTKSNPVSKNIANRNEKNYRIFIALFDYDPFKMSPNTDSCQEELPFKEGQLIKIFGEQDSDGFYYGESNGRSGFIPCNMVSEVQVDDQEVVKQLLNDSNNTSSNTGANELNADKQKRKTASSKNPNQNTGQIASTTKSKTTKTQSTNKTNQIKEQSFVPINNYNQYKSQNQNMNSCIMVALYDYDPQSLSPNVDADVELPFKTGDIITVYGEMDEDGFYMGELNGKRGLVPSNFLQPVDQDQQYNSHNDKFSSRPAEPIKISIKDLLKIVIE